MLFKKPMVIAYRTSALNYFLARLLVKTAYIGLPNLLAGEALVPEVIQKEVKPELLACLLLAYFTQPAKIAQLERKFTELHHELAQQADTQAATAILNLLKAKKLI